MLTTAWVLVAVGLTGLVLVVPLLGVCLKNSDARTDFFSARALYWCVITGLILFGIAAIGVETIRIAAFWKGR